MLIYPKKDLTCSLYTTTSEIFLFTVALFWEQQLTSCICSLFLRPLSLERKTRRHPGFSRKTGRGFRFCCSGFVCWLALSLCFAVIQSRNCIISSAASVHWYVFAWCVSKTRSGKSFVRQNAWNVYTESFLSAWYTFHKFCELPQEYLCSSTLVFG